MINNFSGEYAFLSNFYYAVFLDEDNVEWPTAEHFFQAMKSSDREERENIRRAGTPGQAKRLGRKCAMRPEWENVKLYEMLRAVTYKFGGNSDLEQKLLATGNETLVEGNYWHDNFWGSCQCEKCGSQGKNHLGKLLMQIRTALRDS
jgi:ribA/ribD-fused uncharacterized protein